MMAADADLPVEIVDYASPAAPRALIFTARVSLGGVTISHCLLPPNPGIRLGASQLLTVFNCDPFDLSWRAPGDEQTSRRVLAPGEVHVHPADEIVHKSWPRTGRVLTVALDRDFVEPLLTETVREPVGFGHAGQSAAYVRYRPTPAAAGAIRPAADRFLGGIDLCFARRRVAAVRTFTEPADMAGLCMTRVTYSWRLAAVAPWANRSAIRAAFPQLAATLDAPQGAATETLIQTDRGWTHQTLAASR